MKMENFSQNKHIFIGKIDNPYYRQNKHIKLTYVRIFIGKINIYL